MPTLNVFRGDAPLVRQVWTVGPPPQEKRGLRFLFSVNGKTLAVDGWDAAAIVAAWKAAAVPEFRVITPSAGPDGGYTGDAPAVILTGPSDGTPFDVAVTAEVFVAVSVTQTAVAAVNEVQRLMLPAATGGTFALTYDFGAGSETTSAIAYGASAATVQAALEALASVASGDVTVTKDADTSYAFAWSGGDAASEVPEATADTTSLTVATSPRVTTTIAGKPVTSETQYLSFTDGVASSCSWNGTAILSHFTGTKFGGDGAPGYVFDFDLNAGLNAALGASNWSLSYPGGGAAILTFAGALAGTAVPLVVFTEGGSAFRQTAGTPATNEAQRVQTTGVGGGTFTLAYSGQTTSAIAWNAAASAVQAALEALSSIGAGNVAVTGSAGDWLVTFTGTLATTNVAQIAGDGSGLTGSAPGYCVEIAPHVVLVNEVQIIALPGAVTGGVFTLSYAEEETGEIA